MTPQAEQTLTPEEAKQQRDPELWSKSDAWCPRRGSARGGKPTFAEVIAIHIFEENYRFSKKITDFRISSRIWGCIRCRRGQPGR